MRGAFFILLTCLILINSVIFVSRVFSYNDTVSHPSFTENIAFVYNDNSDRKLSNNEIGWLKWGSIEEDTPPRWMRHFYEPNLNKGLAMYMTSREWVQSPEVQSSSLGGDHSWQKAINSYIAGDNRTAFIALGHVLHLLEDATVPAHTRLDVHIKGDPYEKWVEENAQDRVNFKAQPTIVNDLSDVFYRLAMYSNKYFFSEDTITKQEITNKGQGKVDIKMNDGRYRRYIISQDLDRITFKLLRVEKTVLSEKYSIDEVVNSDYFNLLVPKAVAYGAGVIKLFFEEVEKKKQEETQKSWWEKTENWLNDKKKYLRSSLLNVVSEENGQSVDLIEQGVTIDQNALNNLANQQQNLNIEQTDNNQIISTKPEFNVQEDSSARNNEAETNQQAVNQQQNNQNNENSEDQNQSGEQVSDSKNQNEEISGEFSTGSNNNNGNGNNNENNNSENNNSESNNLPPGSSIGTSRRGMPDEQTEPNATSTPTDTTPPQTFATSTLFSNNETTATSTAIFEFSSSEANSTFECQLDNVSSTLCVSPIQYNNLANGSHTFSVKAIDQAGNQDETPEIFNWNVDVPAPQNPIADHVVISEVAITGSGGANDEWIELYNPTDNDIDLSGWSIQYRGSGAESFSKKNFAAANIILASGFFLIANNNYTGGIVVDLSHNSFSLSSTGGNIFLVNNQITLTSATSTSIIDKLSYGSGTYLFPEGQTFSQTPSSSESIERKAAADSTAENLATGNDKWQGNKYDSNNNSQDFVLQASPTPQNSQSLTEPRSSFPLLSTSAPWSMFQGNEKHTGLINSELPVSTTTPQVLFEDASITFKTPPVIGQNKLFIGASDGIHAFDLSGNQIWLYASNESGYGSPLILADGTIYARMDGKGLYAFSYDGVLKWQYPIIGNSYDSSPNIDKNGVIYTIAPGKLYAIYPDGKLKWIFDIANLGRSFNIQIGSPAIDNVRERVYINIEDYLYALDFSGNLVWEFQDNPETQYFGVPALDQNGTIYAAVKYGFPNGGFYALNPDKSIKWFKDFAFVSDSGSSPAIGTNGTIYFAATKYYDFTHRRIYALDSQTGAEKWYKTFSFDNVVSSPITDGNNVYFPFGARVYAYDGSGNILWYWPEIGPGFDKGFGAADGDGNLYFAMKGQIYKMGN